MSMSLRAYARHRGVALSAVQKAIASGRIHPEPDGSIDPIKADAQWDRHTRTAQPTTPRVTTARPPPVSQPAAPPPMPQASDDARGVDYHKARAVRETYSARLAKLEFEERTGKLISKDEVDIKYSSWPPAAGSDAANPAQGCARDRRPGGGRPGCARCHRHLGCRHS